MTRVVDAAGAAAGSASAAAAPTTTGSRVRRFMRGTVTGRAARRVSRGQSACTSDVISATDAFASPNSIEVFSS